MSAIEIDVVVRIEYDGDEQEALADVYDVVEALPADYKGLITGVSVHGWST